MLLFKLIAYVNIHRNGVIKMDYKAKYNEWLTFDEETKAELLAIADEKEIEDRFYKDLEFGSGGLRGVMGAGANRMNKYYTKIFGLVLRKSTFYNLLICLVTVAFILVMMAIFG